MNKRRSLLTACVTMTALAVTFLAKPSGAVDEVGRIRQKCEEFFGALAKNEYNLFAKGKEPKYARIHKDYGYLFKTKKIKLLRQRAESSEDPAESRAMVLLANALSHHAVISYAAEDMDQMYEFMMTAEVNVDGEKINFGDVRRRIAVEADRNKRRQIYIAFSNHLEPLGVFKLGILSKMGERVAEWGFESLLDMLAKSHEVNLDSVKAQAEQFLDSTDAIYTSELSKLCESQIGVELRRARGYDIPYVLRGSWLDGGITRESITQAVKATFQAMGLKGRGGKGKVEDQAFSGESFGPRVFALRVPDDIKMCYRPVGGPSDIPAELYARGRAEYLASIRQRRYFELGILGSTSLDEAAGLLFMELASNKKWLSSRMGLSPEKAEAVARLLAFVGLFEARRNCASVLFQVPAYRREGTPQDLYGDVVRKYMKWEPVLDRSRAPLEMNDLASAHLVEGYFLASQLRSTLEKRFGEEWFNSKEAGKFLQDLWARGHQTTMAEMLRELGYDGLDPSYLVADVSKAINSE